MITRADSIPSDTSPLVDGIDRFQTSFRFTDRRTKAEYVWRKYQAILQGAAILDVGADECYLKQHLDADASYWGIGIGGHPDQQVDLEAGQLPFGDLSYDCCLCLDVLEHIESIHAIFDELCRVARRHVVISLPNPWANFWRMLRKGTDDPLDPLKFYGLPQQRPEDRHRWFFGAADAKQFIQQRAAQNQFRVVQLDYGQDAERQVSWLVSVKRRLQTLGLSAQFDRDCLYAGSVWAVLERTEPGDG